MIRKFLTCDICGDKWDITDTNLNDKVSAGLVYTMDKVRDGCRRFHLQSIEVKSDDLMYREDLDICDKCYNKLDKFIYDLANGRCKDAGI